MAAAEPRDPARQLAAGDRFAGKYILGRRIAVGGMGEIWVARNQMTGAEVALKALRSDLDRKLEVEARFRHEAQLGAMLSHRNIVRVFDLLIEPDGTLVLVMELLRGETLRHFLKTAGPLSATQAIAIMGPVLSALQHAHEMGIVHRDLKPANLLLAVDPDGHVTPKLLDFGIAKIPASGVKTMFGRVLGTPRYMSPEQIRSDPKIDGRSDVFSAATLLVEMMTGASPFAASSPSASLAAVLEQQVDPDPRIDPRLWLVIHRALAKRPYERYATASEFATALRQALAVPEGDLQATLQRTKPPIDRPPSFSDISPTFENGSDDDDDNDEERGIAAGAASGDRIATGDRKAPAEAAHEPGPATGAMSISLRAPNRTTRMVVTVTLGAALALVLAAAVVHLRAPAREPASHANANATASVIELPPNIPPPPPIAPGPSEDLDSTGAADPSGSGITIESASPPAPSARAAATASKPSAKPHASPAVTSPRRPTKTVKKNVAAKPDF
jgi:serine/threonine-protein kinase